MKKNDKLSNNSWLQRLTLFVVSLICVLGSVQATSTEYYYRATATASPSAGGKVYVSKNQINNPIFQDSPMSINGSATGYFGIKPNQTLYFYAQANSNYAFLGWRENGEGNYVSTSPSISPTKQITSTYTSNNNRTQIKYTAYFQKVEGKVKVVSTDTQKGYVQISNINNGYNDVVTIQAFPDVSKGVFFLGWKTTQSDDAPYVTTNNPYTLTVTTETEGTYYAYFSKPATTVYCLLKNTDFDNYLSLVGNGKATPHKITKTYSIYSRTVQDGYNFVDGLQTIPENKAVNNPLIVFKRVASDNKGYLACDVEMNTDNKQGKISTGTLIGKDVLLTFTPSPKVENAYRISTTIHVVIDDLPWPIGTQEGDLESYLCDNGDGSVSMKSFEDISSATGIDWEITFLTEKQVEGAFGVKANPKSLSGDKYYTSMYAPFAYKMLDGVKAYYLHPGEDVYDEVENKIHLTPVEGDVVPPNMAVILECNTANDATQNRLLPLAEYSIEQSVLDEYKKNVLLGYNHVVSRNGYEGVNAVFKEVSNKIEPQYLYIFSIKNQALGFYHYSGDVIPPNKAYLYIPVDWENISDGDFEKLNNVKLAFGFNSGDENLNSISLFDDVVDYIDLPIYNLQGVQVKNPEKGIYIRDGKKYLVK